MYVRGGEPVQKTRTKLYRTVRISYGTNSKVLSTECVAHLKFVRKVGKRTHLIQNSEVEPSSEIGLVSGLSLGSLG